MPDYSNAVIYKITQRDGKGEFYIGSTCDLKNRVRQHKCECTLETSRDYHRHLYEHIRANGNWINWEVQILEDFACESKEELEIRERYWIEKERPSLNENRPARAVLAGGKKEAERQWRKENADRMREYQRQYNLENADRIREYKRQWQEENADRLREKAKQWRKENADRIREKKRQYREENREAVRERKARYYQEHKEQITEKLRQPITCECGKVIQRTELARHRRTKYHLTHTPALTAVPTPGGGLGGVTSGVGTNIEGNTEARPSAKAPTSANISAPP